MFLFRTSKELNIGAGSNVSLYTTAGSPPHALNIVANITGALTSTGTGTAALDSGTWKGGSNIYIKNIGGRTYLR